MRSRVRTRQGPQFDRAACAAGLVAGRRSAQGDDQGGAIVGAVDRWASGGSAAAEVEAIERPGPHAISVGWHDIAARSLCGAGWFVFATFGRLHSECQHCARCADDAKRAGNANRAHDAKRAEHAKHAEDANQADDAKRADAKRADDAKRAQPSSCSCAGDGRRRSFGTGVERRIFERLIRQFRLSMRRLHLRRYALLAPLIALVVGYATGHSPASAGNATTMAVPGASLTLEYPVDWRAARPPSEIAALDLQKAVVLAPHGDADHGGLLVAAVTEGPAPLPSAVMARLIGGLQGDAISLLGSPAFRYAHLSIARFDMGLTAYAIPTGGERFTFAMCFAPRGRASTRAVCEEIIEAGEVSNEGGSPLPELRPDAAYASRLSAALDTLAAVKREVRASMAKASSASGLAREATRLASALAIASATLRRLSTPPVAAGAAAKLARAMLGAELAYEALAKDAVEGTRSKFVSARREIGDAEAGIGTALRSFALLGYQLI